MATPGGHLRAEDQPARAEPPARPGAADLQGAEPGGAALPPPEGPAGGGPDVPEEPGSDRGPAVRPGVGADGAGADGTTGPARAEGGAAVRPLPGGPAEPGADRPLLDPGPEWPVDRDRPSKRHGRPPPGPARPHSTPRHPVTWDQL